MSRISFKSYVASLDAEKLSKLNYVEDPRYHYVYRITNILDGKHYYGSRTSSCSPELDLGVEYHCSIVTEESKWIIEDQKSNTEKYEYKIIRSGFKTRTEANIYESYLHFTFDVQNHELFYNGSNQSPYGFDRTGVVSCINILTNESLSVSKDVFDSNSNLVGVNFGNKLSRKEDAINGIYAIDLLTKEKRYVTKEEFHSNCNLKHANTYGNVSCIDIVTGNKVYITVEEYHNNKHIYKSKTSGSVVFDIRTGIRHIASTDEIKNNRYLMTVKNLKKKYILCDGIEFYNMVSFKEYLISCGYFSSVENFIPKKDKSTYVSSFEIKYM